MEFKFKKRFGQNFLNNDNIIKKIVISANIKENSLVIEIGPGNGAMTKELLKTNSSVLCYEIDNDLIPILESKFNNDNFNLIHDDFLKRNIKEDIKDYKHDNLYVIANLPYYITTPIINKLIDENLNIEKMTLMVQKEVGERFTSPINNKEYSSITVYLNYHFDVKREFIVKRNNFTPKPNVDSMIISLNKKEKLDVNDEKLFFKLIKDSFTFKRKNLRNNLKEYDLDKIEDALKKTNKDLTYRAEQLSLEDFVFISNYLGGSNE